MPGSTGWKPMPHLTGYKPVPHLTGCKPVPHVTGCKPVPHSRAPPIKAGGFVASVRVVPRAPPFKAGVARRTASTAEPCDHTPPGPHDRRRTARPRPDLPAEHISTSLGPMDRIEPVVHSQGGLRPQQNVTLTTSPQNEEKFRRPRVFSGTTEFHIERRSPVRSLTVAVRITQGGLRPQQVVTLTTSPQNEEKFRRPRVFSGTAGFHIERRSPVRSLTRLSEYSGVIVLPGDG